jgi:hypothetical protein
MSPTLDPDFALQTRLSFGRDGRYALAIVATALIIGFGGIGTDESPGIALARAGMLLLIAAPPYAAVNIRALERDGRLDARRLTGRAPHALAAALLAGSSWAMAIPGAALLLAAAVSGRPPSVLMLAAMASLAVAVMLLILVVPAPVRVDSWTLIVLLASGLIVAVQAIMHDRGAAIGLLVVGGIVCGWAGPVALRRMRVRPAPVSGPAAKLLHSLADMKKTARPEFSRALLSSGASLLAGLELSIAAPFVVYALTRRLTPEARDLYEVMLVYTPLLLAGYDIATRLHADRQSGGFDRLRLTARAPGAVVLEQATALAGPFVLVSLVAAAAVAILDPANARILERWPIIAIILVLGPAAGALRGQRIALTLLVVMPLAGAVGRTGLAWPPAILTAATVIALILLGGELGTRAMSGRWTMAGAAGVAFVAGAIAEDAWSGIFVAAVLPPALGLFVSQRTRLEARTIAGCAVAAAVAAGVAEYLWVRGDVGFQVSPVIMRTGTYYRPLGIGAGPYAVIVAASAAASVFFACRAVNRWPNDARRSFIVRALPLVAAFALSTSLNTRDGFYANQRFMQAYGYSGFGLIELVAPIALALAGALVTERRRPS